MGTDIRKVPLTWKHPRKENGDYIQISIMSYDQALEEYAEDPEEYDNVKPAPEKYFPELKEGEPFGFMFYSSISDMPLSDQIFTDRREMKKWWIYESRARDASRQNRYATKVPDRIEAEIDQWFDMEDVPNSKHDPITQDEMPRCIVLDDKERRIYARARAMYEEICDDPGRKSDALDAMFEMFDEWLKDDE